MKKSEWKNKMKGQSERTQWKDKVEELVKEPSNFFTNENLIENQSLKIIKNEKIFDDEKRW